MIEKNHVILMPCPLCSSGGMIPDRRIPREAGGMICPRCAGSRIVEMLYITPYPFFMEHWSIRHSEAA